MYKIDHCVAGCMTRYLPREKLSPVEAKEVPKEFSEASKGENFSQDR